MKMAAERCLFGKELTSHVNYCYNLFASFDPFESGCSINRSGIERKGQHRRAQAPWLGSAGAWTLNSGGMGIFLVFDLGWLGAGWIPYRMRG
jgi:hypothetical protein